MPSPNQHDTPDYKLFRSFDSTMRAGSLMKIYNQLNMKERRGTSGAGGGVHDAITLTINHLSQSKTGRQLQSRII
jgi:hypothetical protein